jgi:hypothetical protein
MASRVSHTTFDCHDAFALSTWWKQVLDYTDLPEDLNEPGHAECVIVDPRTGHQLLFIEVPDDTLPGKRMHLDLAPIDRTRDEEVIRVTALGATVLADRRRPDGTGWVVFADPEGNEFCVVRSDAERGQPRTRRFTDASLSGARFSRCALDGAVFRGVSLVGASIDAEFQSLVVNGVDVGPFVEAELNRQFPGRDLRRSTNGSELRQSWELVQAAWHDAVARVRAMPPEVAETGVDGEWSFLQTMRHLVMATDIWLRGAIQRIDPPYHPIGLPFTEYETDGDMSFFTESTPTFDRVLEVRTERQEMLSEFLSTATIDDLNETRTNPWATDHTMTVAECIGVIVSEEWDHLRFALRDLDAVTRSSAE